MQAIAGAMGPPSLEDLEDFDFTDEAFEDPLGHRDELGGEVQEEGRVRRGARGSGEGEGA